MRFTEYLTEAGPQQGDWIRKAQKADRQRARRATQKRGEANKQMLAQAGNPQPAIQPPGAPKQSPAPKGKPAEASMVPNEILQQAKGNRRHAVEFITLLGAMYQAKRRNPQVQLTVPMMVQQSQNKEAMMALFQKAKDQDLPQLAKMSEEIRIGAAAPGTPAPTGTQTAPQTPGQTPAGKSMLQKLLNQIHQATKSLSPADFLQLRKKIDKAAQNAKPNPSAAPQPIGKPVITQG